MDLPDIPLLSMLRERMTWLNQRQDVLSQNVANADTPGYVARDLKPLDFSTSCARRKARRATAASMRVTDPRHIAISPSSQRRLRGLRRRTTPKPIPTAIRCRWNMEMIKVSDTQAQFQAATNLYAKAMTMMKTAIGH